jgi:hypothetical protein
MFQPVCIFPPNVQWRELRSLTFSPAAVANELPTVSTFAIVATDGVLDTIDCRCWAWTFESLKAKWISRPLKMEIAADESKNRFFIRVNKI